MGEYADMLVEQMWDGLGDDNDLDDYQYVPRVIFNPYEKLESWELGKRCLEIKTKHRVVHACRNAALTGNPISRKQRKVLCWALSYHDQLKS